MSKWVRCGTVDRRILILYRIAPGVPITTLPSHVRPAEVQGWSWAGIAFSRRSMARSRLLRAPFPAWQTAAHFILVCDSSSGTERLVAWVMRRDCSARWQWWAGGPQARYHASFHVVERGDGVDLRGDSDDRKMHMGLQADLVRVMPEGSIFRSVDQARICLWESVLSLGLATGTLRQTQVRFQPLKPRLVESSVFERFHRETHGQIEFDSAYWLRDDELAWVGEGTLCCDVATA